MKGYTYMLLCENGYYYTGSTIDLKKRLHEHWSGQGANFTKKYPPVKLVYVEEHDHIAIAFKPEKQLQNWSHDKKNALTENQLEMLHQLAACQNASHYLNRDTLLKLNDKTTNED
ncbi:MAG: GIY-YIG nuclease family protein [Bacteroidetes bacterium]|nr:GIY-YIG nuclease family protein [Bacteroidota bacterium]MBU1578776.1 GIY-YIG nuclease family protein [Bacteroidota bacterium]MBU2558567.1 GIY-YIG nuclease family protein [Bacteroidota bacterium]